MLPDQRQGPGGPPSARVEARTRGAAPHAQTWPSGCLILVSGSGRGSALAATACALPQLAVAAAPGP